MLLTSLSVAERTGDYDIATLDRRHFTIIRAAGNETLRQHDGAELGRPLWRRSVADQRRQPW